MSWNMHVLMKKNRFYCKYLRIVIVLSRAIIHALFIQFTKYIISTYLSLGG